MSWQKLVQTVTKSFIIPAMIGMIQAYRDRPAPRQRLMRKTVVEKETKK